MKVQVISGFPVLYDKVRYYTGEVIDIEDNAFNEKIFIKMDKEASKKTSSRKKKNEE